jgi:hypothetical protein
MKKFKLLSAVALIGFVGLSARAAITNADFVDVKFTLLIQTNGSDGLKVKITNKDVLQAIANEFTNKFPSKVVPKGAKLAIAGALGGVFEVFTNKALLLANANTNPAAGGDGYQLSLSTKPATEVTTQSTSTKLDETLAGSLTYNQAGSARAFTISGLASFMDTKAKASSTTFDETFTFGGSGAGTVNGANAVVSGTVTGTGEDIIILLL